MKFGTSGLRGLSADLVGPASSLYAEAFVEHLRRQVGMASGAPVFIGRDFRASSPEIRDRCSAGVSRQGVIAIDCGALPTPALAGYAMGQGAPGLMITGSHIPGDRNGIKFYLPDGEIGKDDEAAIKAIAEELRIGYEAPDFNSGSLTDDKGNAMLAFSQRCQSILPKGNLKGLRVGVYEHSSVGRDLLHEVLGHFGADTVSLGRSESFVAVDTEAVSAGTCELLAGWAAEHRLDAIVSTDGDADRPLVADGNGVPLRGDLVGLVTAEFVGASVVATPVTSNSGIASTGTMNVTRTRVGSPYVIEAMKAASGGTIAGFEANGGFLLQTDAQVPGGTLRALPTRDCILPIIAALHSLTDTETPLSRFAAARDFPAAVADRLQDFPTAAGQALVEELGGDSQKAADYFAPVGEVTDLNTTDGARFTLNGNEIVHYRPSGNAPELRCYCEAVNDSRARELLGFGLGEAAKRSG